MNLNLIIAYFLAFPFALSAQYCGFSEGKNLAQLRASVFAKEDFRRRQPAFQPFEISGLKPGLEIQPPLVFLPAWSAEKLPFFCKIEHDWGKKSRLPFKFRLGSVEYVDWLEGK